MAHQTHSYDRYTDHARKALDQAQAEAKKRGHNFVGTEHLLLALIADPESIASGILEAYGMDYAKVGTAVDFILGHGETG